MQYLVLLLVSLLCCSTVGVLEAKTKKKTHASHKGKKKVKKPKPPKPPKNNPENPITIVPTTVFYVDNNRSSPGEETGAEHTPFHSIQNALKTISQIEEIPSENLSYTLFVTSGIYDEDIIIHGVKQKITLVALGPVQIGNNESPKKLIWKTQTSPYDQTKYTLRLTTLLPQISGTDEPNGFCITGGIKVFHTNKQPCSLVLDEVTVLGAIETQESSASIYTSNAHIVGDIIGGTSSELTQATRTVFDGKVTVRSYGQIMLCHMKRGLQLYAVSPRTKKVPEGILLSRLEGSFEGPARSLRLDAYTNNSFIRKNAELKNETTKELLFSPIP